jgi:DNA replication protein DnaC
MQPEQPEGLPEIGKQWSEKWLALEMWNPEICRLSDVVEDFCRQAFRNHMPHPVVLAGQSGTGKTFAMRGAHKWIKRARILAAERNHWTWPPIIQWTNWPQLIRPVVEGQTSMADALQDSMQADILFLDDIGAESDKYKSAENVDALCQLLSKREKKWTLITTNFRTEQWDQQFDARVADRLMRNSIVCDLECGSYATR